MYKFFVVALGIAATACGLNQTGNLSAPSGGDRTNTAKRGSPLAAIHAACGVGKATPTGDVIARAPYLQQVTATSAKVGWVTRVPTGERVDVSLPDGTKVSSVVGIDEAGAVRSSGEHQMWASIEDLMPDTVYCYEVANGTVLQQRTGFRTAPAPTNSAPVRFLAFGDSGSDNSDQHALQTQMHEFPYDLMIHTGDLAYDDGTLGQYESTVFGVYADLFRSIPFFPAAGNHDYNTASGAAFRSVFSLPGDSGEKWYSYDWGRVHFVALDTEADYAEQAAWLDRDLAATTQPWKIVYMHRPPYSSGDHGSDTSLRAKLAPVLEKHRVQLVLAGHDHNYERTTPQNGIAYVVTGGGGRGTRSVGKSSFTAFAAEVIHFVYVEVALDQLVLHAIDATGAEFDSMVVAR
jgi:predicted phosphodiesterase